MKTVPSSLIVFESEFSKLNAAQKKAVETIEGPVMVIAGPGTGKTQTLSMRVANILRKTQLKPGNVLCLTFSVSGATAMRERLRLLIGPDAYGVTVSTIHSFCQSIISDHPSLFDDWSALEQISDIERFREMNKIIDQHLPDLAIVNPKSPYARTKEILDRISQVKREGKTVEDLEKVAIEYEQAMGEKSKPGTKAHEKNLLAARKFKEFIKLFVGYKEMLSATGRYDYEDMILYVISALEKEEWLLASLQERYLYFLVDEFQDINGAQYRFIELLTQPVTPEDLPNLFVVGDDDQAIYRFQGANLANILSFRERFPDSTVIALETSYRSTQSILDAAERLITKNSERLVGKIPGLQKHLRASNEMAGDAPSLLRVASDTAEPWLIADLLETHLANSVKPSQIAVLTLTNGELRPIYDVLRARGIPVSVTGKEDLLSHPLILQALAILRAIKKPEDNARLSAAIASLCFGCHSADLGRLYSLCREQKVSLLNLLLSLDQENSITSSIRFADTPRLIAVRDLLLDMHARIPTRTVVEIVERIILETGLLKKGGDIHPFDLAALQAFFNHARMLMIEQPGVTFEMFMADLDFYSSPEYGIRLRFSVPHLVTEAVQLMTAHQSKGLEFEVVILKNFREGHWDKHRTPSGLSIPEDLLFGWEKAQKDFEKNQDERRVTYVAMTRAKRHLIFTCPRELTAGEKAKAVSPSAFFAEAGPLPEEERQIKDPERASTLLLRPVENFDSLMRDFLLDKLRTFSLSASGLNRFLSDPIEFLRVDLLQVPQLSDYAFAYGNAVHWALRQWGFRMQRGMPMDSEELLGEFRNYLLQREFLTDAELKRLLHLGEEAVPRYFQQRLKGSVPYIERIESQFNARLGDIPIKGLIDRIDRDHPESALGRVIDYKTGRPQSESQIRGGDYFRQLQFYAILLEHAYPSLTPREFILEFVGEREEHPVARSFSITDEEKKEMRKLISDVWKKILALDFTSL